MLEKVFKRLKDLGVVSGNEPSTQDGFLLEFAIDKVTKHIQHQTNLDYVPEGLSTVAVDMVVGEFLFTKKAMGLLSVESLNFEAIVKQVQDGDTNIAYAVEHKDSPEAAFDRFVHYLQHNEVDFVRYRVFTW